MSVNNHERPKLFLKLPKVVVRQKLGCIQNQKSKIIKFEGLKKDLLRVNSRFYSIIYKDNNDKRYRSTTNLSVPRDPPTNPKTSSCTVTSYSTFESTPKPKKEVFYRLTGNINMAQLLDPNPVPEHKYKHYVHNYHKFMQLKEEESRNATHTKPLIDRRTFSEFPLSRFNSTSLFEITGIKNKVASTRVTEESEVIRTKGVMGKSTKPAAKKNSIFERRFIKNHKENYSIDHIIEEHRFIKFMASGVGDIYSKMTFPEERMVNGGYYVTSS
jgi:hypothetical protein